MVPLKLKFSYRFRVALVIFWTVFAAALIGWWYFFAIQTVSELSLLEENLERLKVAKRMLLWEGGTLVALLIAGGLGLSYYIIREWREHEKIKNFFLTFAHEVKTPLSALQLRLEAFSKDDKLLRDLRELYRKIENSLVFSELDAGANFAPASLSLSEAVLSLKEDFPDLDVKQEGDVDLVIDPKCCFVIFRNILHNALVHGKASRILIKVAGLRRRKAVIEVSNNGKHCECAEQLGRAPFLNRSGKGTGLGLYLAREMVKISGGEIAFSSGAHLSPWPFRALIVLPCRMPSKGDESNRFVSGRLQ